MIFPLWVGAGKPVNSLWPLFALIAANVAVHFWLESVEAADPELRDAILNHYGASDSGALHVLLAHLLHADRFHLVFNMWFMWLFGAPIAGGLRPLPFLALYFISAFTGTLIQDNLSHAGSIGSSGGVSGLLGFFFTHFLRQPVHCLLLIVPISLPAWLLIFAYLAPDMYSAYAGLDTPVAHWAHLGGFLVGLVFGGIVKRRDEAQMRRAARG